MADGKKKLSLYEKVKELYLWELRIGKKNFWLCVRGFTGQRYTKIEKIPPGEIGYVLEMFQEHFGSVITESGKFVDFTGDTR